MRKDIHFSIIMPTYNRRNCIFNAIDGILHQTYSRFELIIIDDGSNDGTYELVKQQYGDKISNGIIKYILLDTHMGVSHARNIGLKESGNDWIAYCDTDNQWYPEYLESFVGAIKKHPRAKCFYAKLKKKSNNNIVEFRDFDYKKLCVANYIDLGLFVHNKSLYKKYGGFDEKLHRLVDWDLILKYTRHNSPVFVDNCVFLYNDSDILPRISNTADKDVAIAYIRNKHKLEKKKLRKDNMFWLKLRKRLGIINQARYENMLVHYRIKKSKLFDKKWYRATYPDVAAANVDPVFHYLQHGWREGRNPSPKFDNNAYLTANPDVLTANMCPLIHYINYGKYENRHIRPVAGAQKKEKQPKRKFSECFIYILQYPVRVRDEYYRLRTEIKALKNKD